MFGFGKTKVTTATDAGNSFYTDDELLGAYRELTYEDCSNIYRMWSFGKRIVEALPNFAMSAGRTFTMSENIPPFVIDELNAKASEMRLDDIASRASIYARIFGVSFIYLASNKEPTEAVTLGDFQNSDFRYKFNVLDPLSSGANIQVDNNPLSDTFSMVIKSSVYGTEIHQNNLHTCCNGTPLYLQYNQSNFSFSTASVFQNMTLLIRSWNRVLIAMQRMATKSSCLVVNRKSRANVSGASLNSIAMSSEMIRTAENDGVINIEVGEDIKNFDTSGVSELDTIADRMNKNILIALSDTPSSLLLDKNLSQGLNDGDNDMKIVLMSVEKFRLNVLKPIYDFLDKFLCYATFTPALAQRVRDESPEEFGGMSDGEVIQLMLDNFGFSFNELYPQTENEQADTAGKKLDNIAKLKELGAEMSGLENAVNQCGVFENIDFKLINSDTEGDSVDGDLWDGVDESEETAKGIDTKETEKGL